MNTVFEQIKTELAEYIRLYYQEDLQEIGHISPVIEIDGAPEKGADLDDRILSRKLEDLMGEIGESFQQILFQKIDESGMTDAEVYKNANMDRRLFSKIRSNPAYHPQKNTILALSISLKLSLEDTAALLASAGFALSPGNKTDLIVKFFIEHGIYDIQTINYALDQYDQPILG